MEGLEYAESLKKASLNPPWGLRRDFVEALLVCVDSWKRGLPDWGPEGRTGHSLREQDVCALRDETAGGDEGQASGWLWPKHKENDRVARHEIGRGAGPRAWRSAFLLLVTSLFCKSFGLYLAGLPMAFPGVLKFHRVASVDLPQYLLGVREEEKARRTLSGRGCRVSAPLQPE